jgi:hypothetical protein
MLNTLKSTLILFYFYDLFYGILGISDYVASNDGFIGEQWIGNNFWENCVGLIEVLFRNLPEGTDKNHE